MEWELGGCYNSKQAEIRIQLRWPRPGFVEASFDVYSSVVHESSFDCCLNSACVRSRKYGSCSCSTAARAQEGDKAGTGYTAAPARASSTPSHFGANALDATKGELVGYDGRTVPDVVTVEVIWPKESRVMVVVSDARACFEITPLAGS